MCLRVARHGALQARYLRDGRVARGSRAPGAGHLGHSIDELRRQAARAGSHGAVARAGRRARRYWRPGARRTWPLRYQSIDAQRRRGRVAGAAHSCRANSWRPSPVNMNRDPSLPPTPRGPAPLTPALPCPDLLCAGRCRTRTLTLYNVQPNTVASFSACFIIQVFN